ncbi:MAG: hypothetical protein RL213_42 [Bacteroidota bacterium]|jgi:hypothetical protein
MTIHEVSSDKDRQEFLLLPLKIYKNDPDWIRPLDKDIEEVFDPERNKFFRHGKCTRFLLEDGKGETIGRIAVFINERTSKKEPQPTGGTGFFECINDQSAANLLFETAKRWLSDRGMEAMDGPVNFGERDSWWGLLVKGFPEVPYKMNYNAPYYRELFENYGFKTYFEQWCFSLNVDQQLADKFATRHAQVKQDPGYKAEHLRKSRLDRYAEDFRTVYNKAWVKHGSGKALESKQVRRFFRTMKPVIDEKAVWFVYYNGDPVAMWINLPDINQLFRRFDGKFGWMEKLRFVYLLRTGKIDKLIGMVFGIVPEHQGKGVESFMIMEGAAVIRSKTNYKRYEMQWIGDFNPKMYRIAESLGTEKSRILVTYRYLFDRSKEFVRHPIL